MNETSLNPELATLERDLASLSPCPSGLDRDRLMFQAGWAAARKAHGGVFLRRWLWPAATVAASLAAGVLGVLLVVRPTVREVVYVTTDESRELTGPKHQGADAPRSPGSANTTETRPASSAAAAWPVALDGIPSASYLRDRQLALALGLDALPSWSPRGKAPIPLKASDALSEVGIRSALVQ
jgi:hypothetical protein